MVKRLKKVLFDEIHIVELNLIAILGWLWASTYGLINLVREVISAII